jgi:hypothetical protein
MRAPRTTHGHHALQYKDPEIRQKLGKQCRILTNL